MPCGGAIAAAFSRANSCFIFVDFFFFSARVPDGRPAPTFGVFLYFPQPTLLARRVGTPPAAMVPCVALEDLFLERLRLHGDATSSVLQTLGGGRGVVWGRESEHRLSFAGASAAALA